MRFCVDEIEEGDSQINKNMKTPDRMNADGEEEENWRCVRGYEWYCMCK